MRSVFSFEIAMAIKDRPKFFQLITLVLLAFSLTIIIVSSVERLSAAENSKHVYKQRSGKAAHYTSLVSVGPNQLIDVQK